MRGEGRGFKLRLESEGEGESKGEGEGDEGDVVLVARVPVTVTCAPPRRIEKTTSPTAAFARARPWASSVTVVPSIETILSPFTSWPEAAQPSWTSVTITLAAWSVCRLTLRFLIVTPRRVVDSGLSTVRRREGRRGENGCEGRECG